MNPEQMIQDLKMKEKLIDSNLEMITALNKLSPEQQKVYAAQVETMINITEQLIKQ